VGSTSGTEDVLDFLLVIAIPFSESAQVLKRVPEVERGETYLDLTVGPLAVRLADEGRDVTEEDDEGTEDDDFFIEDEELVRDGSGRGGSGESYDSRLRDERVSGKGIDQSRSLSGRCRLAGLESSTSK